MQALHTADDLPLHLRRWSVAGAAHGTVLIVHGLGEHVGRYQALAMRLNAARWHVVGHDHRGHGASGGARGALAAPDSLLADLALVIDAVAQEPPTPLVLLGHSLGGLVAARFVAEGLAARPAPWWRPVQALMLSSPALDPGMNAAQRLLLAVLGPLAPNLAVGNGLDPEWISREPAVVAAYRSDPLVHDRVTPRLARFIVDAGEQVRALAARWTVPTLLQWAGADRCVAPRGSAAFAAAAPQAVVTALRYPHLAHEIFNEPERDLVIGDLLRWLADVRGTPAPVATPLHGNA
ncbi:MAG: alpha/beta hydrolase [Burkholderiaceae bacterium]